MAPVTWCFGFPYCPNEPIREQAWGVVEAFYDRHFPSVHRIVHSATAVGEPFLRAKTRNQIVRQAQHLGFDIVVLIDADTLIHPDGIRRMVDLTATQDLFLGKPFIKGVNLPLAALQGVADGGTWPSARFNDPGAAWVIRPETWWTAGGMDEGFTSWGGEDEAFDYLFAAVHGTTEYDRYPAVKTDHPTPRWRRDPNWADTWEREAVCRHVWRNPHLVPEWLEARDQPGVCAEWITRYSIDTTRSRSPLTR